MKSLLSVLALGFGALTFQSCEVYPNGTSRGHYEGAITGVLATTMAATTGAVVTALR
jgi:hypothetical protein